jgi:YebC/PmpR family DNA-binding regulatory protein
MGRAFEARRGKKEKRWSKMSKAFSKLGKELTMAVKAGGANPDSNLRLKTAIQNAKGVNMPKDKVEAAIKRAVSKEEKDFMEIIYEGYGPHGIAIMVETATDNSNRTVANLRAIFNRADGVLGNSGSVEFMFTRKGLFKINSTGVNVEDLELELIDFGLDEIQLNDEEEEIWIYSTFTEFGAMQKALEDKKIEVINAELVRVPTTTVSLTEEQEDNVMELLDKLEEDDDVQNVFHTIG